MDWVDASHRQEFEAALENDPRMANRWKTSSCPYDAATVPWGIFSISLSPMRDEQNTVNSLVVVMTDITDAALLQAKTGA